MKHDSRDWRSHLDQMHSYRDGIESSLTSTKTQLDKLHTDIARSDTLFEFGISFFFNRLCHRVPRLVSRCFPRGEPVSTKGLSRVSSARAILHLEGRRVRSKEPRTDALWYNNDIKEKCFGLSNMMELFQILG